MRGQDDKDGQISEAISRAYGALSSNNDNLALCDAIGKYEISGTGPSSEIIRDTFVRYAIEEDPQQKVALLLRVKELCAEVTIKSFEHIGLRPNYVIVEPFEYVYMGVTYKTKKYQPDLVEIKGECGVSYFYEIGTSPKEARFSANEVEKYLSNAPYYVLDYCKGLVSCCEDNPCDEFYQLVFNGFRFRRGDLYSGGIIKVHTRLERTLLSKIMHEGGHNIDTDRGASAGYYWREAIKADGSIYPSDYARQTNAREDFAESFMLFVDNPMLLKQKMPNRYKYIEALITWL